MNAQTNVGWADRLGPTARTIVMIVTIILGIFAIGMVAGFSYAMIEDGRLPTKPLAYVIFAAMLGLVAGTGWMLLSLFRSIHPNATLRSALLGIGGRRWPDLRSARSSGLVIAPDNGVPCRVDGRSPHNRVIASVHHDPARPAASSITAPSMIMRACLSVGSTIGFTSFLSLSDPWFSRAAPGPTPTSLGLRSSHFCTSCAGLGPVQVR